MRRGGAGRVAGREGGLSARAQREIPIIIRKPIVTTSVSVACQLWEVGGAGSGNGAGRWDAALYLLAAQKFGLGVRVRCLFVSACAVDSPPPPATRCTHAHAEELGTAAGAAAGAAGGAAIGVGGLAAAADAASREAAAARIGGISIGGGGGGGWWPPGLVLPLRELHLPATAALLQLLHLPPPALGRLEVLDLQVGGLGFFGGGLHVGWGLQRWLEKRYRGGYGDGRSHSCDRGGCMMGAP